MRCRQWNGACCARRSALNSCCNERALLKTIRLLRARLCTTASCTYCQVSMSKADQTRDRILSEALRQGTIRGFSVVSLSDVAESTGLSKSAVFKHFGAKDALQIAAMEKLAEDFTLAV